MWLVLGIFLVVFLALIGYLLIYSGSADVYGDDDGEFEDCWRCCHCNRVFGICRLTNAHVRRGQKCNLNEEMERQKKMEESLKKK